MGRARTGNIVKRGHLLYARVTYIGEDGKRHAVWRAAKNRRHAKQLIPEICELIGYSKNKYAKPSQPRRWGFIYAVQMLVPDSTQRPIKIGFTVTVESRRDALTTGSPYPLVILGYWRTSHAMVEERKLHARFAADRLSGEWFRPSPDLLTLIQERTRAYTIKLRSRADEIEQLTTKPAA